MPVLDGDCRGDVSFPPLTPLFLCPLLSSSRGDISYPAEYEDVQCYDQDKNRIPSKSEVGFANYGA